MEPVELVVGSGVRMPSERVQRRIDALLEEADKAISKSDWNLVRDRSQHVLALDPDNSDASMCNAAVEQNEGGVRWQLGKR